MVAEAAGPKWEAHTEVLNSETCVMLPASPLPFAVALSLPKPNIFCPLSLYPTAYILSFAASTSSCTCCTVYNALHCRLFIECGVYNVAKAYIETRVCEPGMATAW